MKPCTNCGEGNLEESRFCKYCGSELNHVLQQEEAKTSNNERVPPPSAKEFSDMLLGSKIKAADMPGTMVLADSFPLTDSISISEIISPLSLLFTQAKSFISNLTGILKNKQRLIFILVLAVLWILLMLLPALGKDSDVLRFLSFLTFAQGGTTGGALGAVGGILGKSIFAYFTLSFIPALFREKGSFKNLFSGFSQLFSSFNLKNLTALPLLLCGLGLSLIAYNFLTGDGSLINSMVGITAFLLSLKTLTNDSGFLTRFIISILTKFKKGEGRAQTFAKSLTAGWTTGFALGVGLSFISYPYTAYYSGIIALVAAVFLLFFSLKRGGVQS